MGKILVVEDNDVLRGSVVQALVENGHNVSEVGDGEEATERLQEESYDVVLTDMRMPKKSGLEVLAWMGENPNLSVVPTIVLSASNLEDDVRAAYTLGANTYFVKPTTFEELVETMRMVENYWHKAMKLRPGDSRNGLRNELSDSGHSGHGGQGGHGT